MITSENNTMNLYNLHLMLIIESYIKVIENNLVKDNTYKKNLLKMKQYLEELYREVSSKNNSNNLHCIKNTLNKIFIECKHLYNGRRDKVYNIINEMKDIKELPEILKKFDKFLLLTYIDFSHNNNNIDIKEMKT